MRPALNTITIFSMWKRALVPWYSHPLPPRSPTSCYSTTATVTSTPVIPQSQPIVELREYQLLPQHVASFMHETAQASPLRIHLLPLRFFSLPETGGPLHIATHAYFYHGGHVERDATRVAAQQSQEWCDHVTAVRPFSIAQASTILQQAPLGQDQCVVPGLAQVPSQLLPGDQPILELRRYRLKLGYDTVPKFLDHYKSGLPSKLMAPGTDPTTSLITVLYSEVGRLNEVIEIWRHGNGTMAMEQSRVAARQALPWRHAIAQIADLAIQFTSTIHKPASFSPIR